MSPDAHLRKRKSNANSSPSTKKSKVSTGTSATRSTESPEEDQAVGAPHTTSRILRDIAAESNEHPKNPEEERDEIVAIQEDTIFQGFDSSSDDDGSEGGGVQVEDVPLVPASSLAQAKSLGESSGDTPGVVYVGRVPHGFYEHQMRAYFSQFGGITKLRLSRNKKTGHSKHYAFIEFASAEVAKIVAATMNKYLLFGHILQVRMLAPEEVHKDLFKGANKRFKPVPRNRIEGRHLRLPKERASWDKRVEAENERRKTKEAKLSAMGYDFKPAPLKATDSVPRRQIVDSGTAT